MRSPPGPTSVTARRLATRWWWLLAIAVGGATLWFATAIVHDTGQRREAATLVARTTADHIAALVSGRLEVMAAITFAPAAPWRSDPGPDRANTLGQLVEQQVAGIECRCRPLAPASHFFRLGGGGPLEIAPVSVAATPLPAAVQAALLQLARQELEASAPDRRATARLLASRDLPGQVAVVVVRRDAAGRGVVAHGLVAPARAMAMAIFPHDPPAAGLPRSSVRVIMLDTLSLAMATADSTPVFGRLASDRPFRATVHPGGALAGLSLTVALAADQVPHRVLIEPDQLWLLALLIACTVVLIGVAAGSARRETQLARARSDFIAGVSHDLRMPLAQVLLAGETLALGRAESGAQRQSLAESIVREARRLTGLVDNVLLFSRSGAVALQPVLRPVEADALLAETAESVGLSVADAGQALVVVPAPGIAVVGDRALLRQALVNLVDNALKYGARGQTIRLAAVPAGAERVELRVEDQGPGIPPPARDRVFEPYARLPADQLSERTGSGLGLAVVRQIAQACQGTVRLAEAAGGGTCAVLSLRAAALREATEQ